VSHANARLTVHGRRLLVERHLQGMPKAHIASAMGVSRKCAGVWIGRYLADGWAGLLDRSSRPHSMPRRTSDQVEQEVLQARREDRSGPDVLGPKLGVPARTVTRILRRHQMPYLRQLDPITGELIRSSKQTAVRYERDRPGELVHMDVKKLGKIPDGGGWRVHGRGGPGSGAKPIVGYDYVHSLIDDHSRLAYSEVLADEKGPTVIGFLTRGIAYFAAHGITSIERLMTDNAYAYRYSLRPFCADLGITQKFIKPHCPWQNGKVERLNRTLATEWAYRRVYTTNQQRTDALAPWIETYNNHRNHSSIAGKPPISRL